MNLEPFKIPKLDPDQELPVSIMATNIVMVLSTWLSDLPVQPLAQSLHDLFFVTLLTFGSGIYILLAYFDSIGKDD